MLTHEEHVEIHALKKRGWSISEIARHTDRDPDWKPIETVSNRPSTHQQGRERAGVRSSDSSSWFPPLWCARVAAWLLIAGEQHRPCMSLFVA